MFRLKRVCGQVEDALAARVGTCWVEVRVWWLLRGDVGVWVGVRGQGRWRCFLGREFVTGLWGMTSGLLVTCHEFLWRGMGYGDGE